MKKKNTGKKKPYKNKLKIKEKQGIKNNHWTGEKNKNKYKCKPHLKNYQDDETRRQVIKKFICIEGKSVNLETCDQDSSFHLSDIFEMKI